jgi:hypothetical protein
MAVRQQERPMKNSTKALLSTISMAAMTAVLGTPAVAAARTADAERPPIDRLASIREAYLSSLTNEWSMPVESGSGDQVAQFRNFPNFPNFSNWRNR